MNKIILLFITSLLFIGLLGCGGSGDNNGPYLNPQQQEFADVVYAFATAVNNKDSVAAKKLILSDCTDSFAERVESFLEKVTDVKFDIYDIGVELDSEEKEAMVNVEAKICYNTDNLIPDSRFRIRIQKWGSKCGIKSFKKYFNEVSAFPPAL